MDIRTLHRCPRYTDLREFFIDDEEHEYEELSEEMVSCDDSDGQSEQAQ